jgi:hypothetical protein
MSNIVDRLNQVLDTLDEKSISKFAHKEFVANTPVRSGNARRNTVLQGNEIQANYGYAEVLDKGRHMTRRGMRGSLQAPKGMTAPTLQSVRDYVYKKLGVRI